MKNTKTIINNLKHRGKQAKAISKAYKEAAERLADLEKIAEFYRNELEAKTQEIEELKAKLQKYAEREALVQLQRAPVVSIT